VEKRRSGVGGEGCVTLKDGVITGRWVTDGDRDGGESGEDSKAVYEITFER
jgi:hypothetical protein